MRVLLIISCTLLLFLENTVYGLTESDGRAWKETSRAANSHVLRVIKLAQKAKSKAKAKNQASVSVMFREGTELYNKGRFGPAMVVYSRILQRYPGHEPSRIQLAKSLYRLEKLKEAYGVFKQLNPTFMDPETAYEYGLTFYKQNDFAGALIGFKQVTADHALRDLACYYGAIAAYKLKRYQEAQELIEGATVLPTKLVKSRDLYRKNIYELRQKEQEEQFRREKALEVVRLKEETNAKLTELEERDRLARLQNASVTNQMAASSKAQTLTNNLTFDGFQSITNRAGGGIEGRAQAVSYREKDEDLQFNRVFGQIEATPIKLFGKTNGFGISVLGRLSDRSYDGLEQRLDDSEEGAMETLLFSAGTGNDKWLFANSYAFIDMAAGPTRVGLQLGTRYLSRDFKGKSTILAPFAHSYVGMKRATYVWRLSAEYSQWNLEKSTLLNYTVEELQGSVRLLPELSALFGLNIKQYHYTNDESGEGPDSKFRVNIGLEANVNVNLGIGTEYRYWNEKDVRHFYFERDEAVVFDTQQAASKVYLFGRLGTWFSVELAATRTQRDYENYAALSEESIILAQAEEATMTTEIYGKAVLNLIF